MSEYRVRVETLDGHPVFVGRIGPQFDGTTLTISAGERRPGRLTVRAVEESAALGILRPNPNLGP